jgi:hypothetical protein
MSSNAVEKAFVAAMTGLVVSRVLGILESRISTGNFKAFSGPAVTQ